MTFLNAPPDSNEPRGSGRIGKLGPFVSIGLPDALASILAGARPILALDPAKIDSAGLHRLDNAMVACLLFGSKMDATDVIEHLAQAGYRGAVTVVAPALPDPRMVERELAQAARSIMVTVVVF